MVCNFSGKKKILFLFLLSFACIFSLFSQNSQSVTKIEIQSAQNTAYKKNEDTGQDEIVLTGAVCIVVSRDGTTTTILADTVTYNRATDMLYATGNVNLKQTGSSLGEQNITAESLLFNTSTLEGIFDNGRIIQTQTDALNLPSGSTLIVASEVFGRDSSSTIAFKNADLTFCDDEDPHWKIKASNIWLLPGGEFAFFNAVLSVGNIPVLYLPAFYYPKDELIFNPSFGYDSKKGYYFVTTTYLLGRKPLNSGSSDANNSDDITAGLFNFMQASSLKEQKREGLVLHNLDSDYKGDTTNYLKVMGDLYSNLGFMVGLDGVYKPSKVISSLSGNLNLGFSKTLFNYGSYYADLYDGTVYHDKSNFMGLELPFRFGGNLSLSMTKPFSLTLSLPFYSDPFFNYDFLSERSEYIDWIGFALSSGSDNDDTTVTTVSSFTWNATASYTLPLPDFFKPYINTVSLSSVSSSLVFNSKNRADPEFNSRNDSVWRSNTPERIFYYPSQVTPVKVSGKISGTLVSVTNSKSSVKKSSNKKEKVKYAADLNVPEDFLTEDDLKKLKDLESDVSEKSSTEEDALEEYMLQKEDIVSISELPQLSSTQTATVSSLGALGYTLSYSISPSFTSQITYNNSTDKLLGPDDFDWSDIYSTYYQLKVPVTLTSSLNYKNNFAAMNNSVTFNPVFQDHPNLDGYDSPTSVASVKKTDFSAHKMDLTNTNSISLKPFVYSPIFKNTGIDWNTTVKLIRTEFIGDVDNPSWNYLSPDFSDDDCISSHTLSATFSAVESSSFSQVLTLSTTLPPQLDKYYATLKFSFPFVNLTFGSGIEQKSETDESFILKPFQQSAAIKLFNNNLSFTESYNYNLEDSYSESAKFSLTFKQLSLSYVMSYTYGYDFVDDKGWEQRTDKEFLPYSLSLAYSTSNITFRWWKNRISFIPGLSTNIVYDCIRPTNSYFKFVPSFSFKINDFLSLSFSSESRNNVIFRYIQKYTPYGQVIAGEENVFKDLLNSFIFWDEDNFYDPDQKKRKASGFKLKSLNISLTHNLHDWDLISTLSFKPRTTTDSGGNTVYDYHPYFSLSVSWRPLASLKAEIVDDYGEFDLNP